MDIPLQAVGKQVTTIGDSDSSFRSPEIASVVRPLPLRVTICIAILIVGLVQLVNPTAYLFQMTIFMISGLNLRPRGSGMMPFQEA